MLHILHDQINEICPISCLYDSGDGNFRIDYIEEPSSEQIDEINILLESWPLEKAKLLKIKQLDINWDLLLSQGWPTPEGWKLGLKTQDVTLLTGVFILAKEAANLGLNDPISIIDIDGISHQLNLQEMTSLMLQYGQARANLSSIYATKAALIKDSQSIEDLEVISINF